MVYKAVRAECDGHDTVDSSCDSSLQSRFLLPFARFAKLPGRKLAVLDNTVTISGLEQSSVNQPQPLNPTQCIQASLSRKINKCLLPWHFAIS